MTLWEALLLAAALCVDTLVVSAAEALRCRMGWRRRVAMAVVFGLCQGLFPLAGAIVGDAARAFIEAVDHWVAFGLLLMVGGKMVADGLRRPDGAEAPAPPRPWLLTCLLLGVATSIDAFAVGIGIGLQVARREVLWIVACIGAVTVLVSLVGSWLGSRRVPIPERGASVVAGVVLVALGTKILVEHLAGL